MLVSMFVHLFICTYYARPHNVCTSIYISTNFFPILAKVWFAARG